MKQPSTHLFTVCLSALILLALSFWTAGCQSGEEKTGEEKTGEEKTGEEKTGEDTNARSAVGAGDVADEVEAIHEAFASFRQAVQERDGKAAIELASSSSVERYSRVRELALAGAKRERLDEIRSSPLGDRVMIAMMLLRLGEERLQPLSGEELFIIGIEQGWIGRRSFEEAELGEVTVLESGVMATSPLIVEGEEQDASWRFVKEEGAWKLDLTALMHFADMQMRKAAKDAGLTEDELVKRLVEDTDDVAVRDVWMPWSPPGGGFRVDLPTPAKPVERADNAVENNGNPAQYWLAKSVQHNAAYMINVSSVEDAPESPAEIADNAIRGVVASSKGELVGVGEFEHRGIKGKQLQLKMPQDMLLSGRIFVHEGKLYQLLVMSEANLGLQHLDRFFGSFVVEK